MGYEKYFIYCLSNTAIPAGSITPGSQPTSGSAATYYNLQPGFRLDQENDFRVLKITYQALSAAMMVSIRDGLLDRLFGKMPSVLSEIASQTVGQPFKMASPYLWRAGAAVIVQVADFSGKTNSLYLCFHGSKIMAGNAPWESSPGVMKTYKAQVPFWYDSDLLQVGASQTMQVPIIIENDAPFLVKEMTGTNFGAIGSLLVDIKSTTPNQGAGYDNWDNQALPFEMIFGNGQFQNYLWDRQNYRYLDLLTVVMVNVINTTASAVNFSFRFGGVKLFS